MGVQQSNAGRHRGVDARKVMDLNPRLIAGKANVSEANVKRAKASGRNHNVNGGSAIECWTSPRRGCAQSDGPEHRFIAVEANTSEASVKRALRAAGTTM